MYERLPLLLQAAARIAMRGLSVAYISGEEAADQVRLRAQRLGLGTAPVQLASATSVRDILTTLGEGPPPALLIIDSIQTTIPTSFGTTAIASE